MRYRHELTAVWRITESTSARWFSITLTAVLIFATILKSALLLRSYGFEQGDPLEYINIAHAIAYHTGEEWWTSGHSVPNSPGSSHLAGLDSARAHG